MFPSSFGEGARGKAHIVSMPEATIHKDASPVLPHHDVRLSWQSWMV